MLPLQHVYTEYAYGTQDNMYVLSKQNNIEYRQNFTSSYNQSKMCLFLILFLGVKLDTKLALVTETSFNEPTRNLIPGDFRKGSH